MRKKRGSGPKRAKPDYTKIATSSRMIRFLNGLDVQKNLFTTRDCLDYGTRASVDKALSRLVEKGDIIRIARGVFMRNHLNYKIPSCDEIAQTKARAFKRELFTHGINCLKDYFDFEHPESEQSYATNAASSSFYSRRGRITFKHYAPRKLNHADTTVGKLIRALWHFRSPGFASEVWIAIRDYLGRMERDALRNSGAIIPSWLVNIVKYNIKSFQGMPPDLEAFWNAMKLRIYQPLGRSPAGDAMR